MPAANMSARLRGIFVPAVTPFAEDGTLDLHAFEANLADWTGSGVRGFMVLGSNGEFRSVDDEESLSLVRTAAGPAGDKTLVVGGGRESLRLTHHFIDRLADIGRVDAVAVLTPHYYAPLMSDEALIDYYVAVADRSPIPVVVYVAPAFASGVALPASAVADLSDHPNICGIKGGSGEVLTEVLAHGPREDFAVLAGSVTTLMTCLAHGGTGGVVSAANYLPESCARVVELFDSGQHEEAADLHARLRDVVARTGGPYSVAGVKACMNALGMAGRAPRLPVRPVPDAVASSLGEVLGSWVTTNGLR